LTDKLGSVRLVVNSSGSVVDTITYDSYGNITNETSPSNGDRFKFTGREWDSEIASYFYRARYYNPSIGRFQSEDPIGFRAKDTNLFRFVANNPFKQRDPTGLDYGFLDPLIDYEINKEVIMWNYFTKGASTNVLTWALNGKVGGWLDCASKNTVNARFTAGVEPWLSGGIILGSWGWPKAMGGGTASTVTIWRPILRVILSVSSARAAGRVIAGISIPLILAEGTWDWTVYIWCAANV
jgi:RHS repeat-associated protein